mgnify:CR=1 FL=1
MFLFLLTLRASFNIVIMTQSFVILFTLLSLKASISSIHFLYFHTYLMRNEKEQEQACVHVYVSEKEKERERETE